MALSTYAELKQAILDHLDRSDLTSFTDDFIDIAEARHKREVRIREMYNRVDLAIADGDRYVSLPADFLDHRYLRILIPDVTSGPRYYPDLEELSVHELTAKSTNDERRPYFYTIHEQLELDCEADRAYTAEIFYYTQLTALSGSATSNALLARAPDVYLYACLLAAAPHLIVGDTRVEMWAQFYENAKNELNAQQRNSRRGGPLTARVSGATP